MRILIANLDYVADTHSNSFEKDMGYIRRYNVNGSASKTEIFDPYGEEGESTLCGADKVFGFARTGFYNGITEQACVSKDLYTAWDGYPQIDIMHEIKVNPIYMPFLSQETLVAYMPHIPWDEFGNHMRLEGEDAEQFLDLWNTFLQQNKDLYNAVYKLEYPVDECMSNIGYIFMDKGIE